MSTHHLPDSIRPTAREGVGDKKPPGAAGTRRDFLTLTTGAFAAAGAAMAVWPFIDQMNPDENVLAQGGPQDFDLSSLGFGQQIVVTWRNRPIFILRRTDPMLALLQQPALVERLQDPSSDRLQQPPYADNWYRSLKPQILVLVGVCTHLGCIPQFHPVPGSVGESWPGGYFCPCHGSKFDFAGRVFSGVPAPLNLPVPPYRWVNDTTVRIGENPPGFTYDLGDIEQI